MIKKVLLSSLTILMIVFSGCLDTAKTTKQFKKQKTHVPAFDPLKRVEEDQSSSQISSADIFNRNILIGSMLEYTHVSSYKRGAFAAHAHDGNEKKAWIMAPGQKEAVLDISWGLAVPINQINLLEKDGQNIKNLKLEIYNGKTWETLTTDSKSTPKIYKFSTRPASSLRISIETDGKEAGIAEVEVYNTQSTSPLPRYGSAELIAAMKDNNAIIFFDGSPYTFSRKGRHLINARKAEACLANIWTKPVLESICASLGGKAEAAGKDQLNVSLNGQKFTIDASPENNVIEQIKQLAAKAKFEFLSRDSLVMVGKDLAALNNDKVISELKQILGQNPYYVSEKSKDKPDAIIIPTLAKEGITYEWAGFRSTADPGTNSDAWLKYAGTKAIRSWVGSPKHFNQYIRPAKKVENKEEFEKLKKEIRANPEKNSIIAYRAFLNKYHSILSEEFNVYNKLGITIVNETGPKVWPDTIHDDFINWAGCYSMTYYLAKNYGVAVHQYGNEPDWYFNKSTDEQVARRLTLVADAIHSAIEDVNRDHKLNLKSVYAAPVLAGDPLGRTARIMMRNQYNRYDGKKSPTKQFQLFNRHRYGGRPYQNASEVRSVKEMMKEEVGVKEVLPQIFTELNYSTGGHWARPHTTFTNDTPNIFTSVASIWGWMMQEQGVYGIFVFKMNDRNIYFYKNRGPFSNTISYSMHPEQDPGVKPPKERQIAYGTKNFEVCRLFGRGFHGSRPLLKTDIDCSDRQYRAWTTFDEKDQCYYIWSVQANDFESYELEFDLSKLDLPAGAIVTAETVSGARHGEVTKLIKLPGNKKIRLHQAPLSAMLLTVHKPKVTEQIIYPEADVTVIQGDKSKTNSGAEKWLKVGRNSNSNSNMISFLKFKLPKSTDQTQRAILEFHGNSKNAQAYDGGFIFRVYAIEDNNWQELKITADNAPNLYKTVSGLKKIDFDNYPVGHVTCFNKPSKLMVDITLAVQEAQKKNKESLKLVLIREMYQPGENTDAFQAMISSKEAGKEQAPKVHLFR